MTYHLNSGRLKGAPALDPYHLAKALGGEVLRDGSILAPGPGHSPSDRSLSIKIDPSAPGGRGFVTNSFAGDPPWLCVRHALEQIDGAKPVHMQARLSPRSRRVENDQQGTREGRARELWRRSVPAPDTPAERYLRVCRKLDMPVPATIRFVPSGGGLHFDAMIAPFHVPTGGMLTEDVVSPEEISGVQVTLLSHDGSSKADVPSPKRIYGAFRTVPIPLASFGERSSLVITEGIEEALTYHLATGLGAWASGGASNLPHLAACVIAARPETVLIGVDRDQAGIQNSMELARHLCAAGIEVLCLRPETFNE